MSGERTSDQSSGDSRQVTVVSDRNALERFIRAQRLPPTENRPLPTCRLPSSLFFAGLVAQVRSAYTRSHPELGRETLQRP